MTQIILEKAARRRHINTDTITYNLIKNAVPTDSEY
jgi:hypothetical protein